MIRMITSSVKLLTIMLVVVSLISIDIALGGTCTSTCSCHDEQFDDVHVLSKLIDTRIKRILNSSIIEALTANLKINHSLPSDIESLIGRKIDEALLNLTLPSDIESLIEP